MAEKKAGAKKKATSSKKATGAKKPASAAKKTPAKKRASSSKKRPEPTHEEIANRAYEIYEREGGHHEGNWLRAERELRSGK
jgi:Protein of unknown function (DUF2934)